MLKIKEAIIIIWSIDVIFKLIVVCVCECVCSCACVFGSPYLGEYTYIITRLWKPEYDLECLFHLLFYVMESLGAVWCAYARLPTPDFHRSLQICAGLRICASSPGFMSLYPESQLTSPCTWFWLQFEIHCAFDKVLF